MSNDVTKSDSTTILLEFLRGRDVYCPLCKYNLRDLKEPRCPECGRKIALNVGMAEPYLRAWIATMVPTTMIAGIGLMAIAQSLKYMFLDNNFLESIKNSGWLLMVIVVYSMLNIPFVAMLVIFRKRFLRLKRLNQWLICLIAWVLAGGVLASIAGGTQ